MAHKTRPCGNSDSTVPLIINYQGHVEDDEGKPLTGYYTITIRIYDDVIGTTSLWEEEHVNVTTREGYFNVLLGNNESLTNTLFTNPDRFIGVTVDPYDEMVPRQRFASVPYAMHSYHATKADHALEADHATQADRALEADHAMQASHASSADDADTVDGLHASDLITDTTMIEGWPDALVCGGHTSSNGGTEIYFIDDAPTNINSGNVIAGDYVYRSGAGGHYQYLIFNLDGTYKGRNPENNHAINDCNGKSISELYAEGKAFNLVGRRSGQ